MATIFQKIFDRFKQSATGGNNSTTSVDQNSQSANTTAASSTTSTSSFSNTLTKDNSIDDIIKQINEINTSVDTSDQENFDINKYLDPVKRGLQDLNGGQIQSDDISKFTNMRTSEAQKEYEDATGRGLDKLEQFTDPNSDVYKTMINRALGNFDATVAATNMSQSMRIANNPYLTDSAKRVAGAELNRVTQSNRAALVGDLTEQVNKMMFDAAKEFTTQSINAAEYEEGKFKTDADLAMREMTNRIAILQLQGDLSITEATLAYQQITDGINNQWKNISAQLEKIALLLDSEEFKLKADEARTAAFDFWAGHSVNRIIELKNSNGGTITLDQVKNDPLTMSYLMKEMEMIGYEGNIDDYIQSRIDFAKTQVQIDQEAIDALKQSYMNIGMDETTASAFANMYGAIQLGAIHNEDGSWSIPGADGKPIMTWDGEKFIFEDEDANKDDSGNDIPTEVGKTYIRKGKLYQVGEDGKGVEIQDGAYYIEGDIVYVNKNGVPTPATMPSELWGADANAIIELGEGTKLYDELITKRKSAITSGEIPAQDIYNDPAKLAVAKELAQPVILTSNWNEHQERRLFSVKVPKVNTPFIYNGKIYIASSDKYFYGEEGKEEAFDAIDAETGEPITIRTYALASKEDQKTNNAGRQSNTVEDNSTTDDSSTTEDNSTTDNSSTTRPSGRSLGANLATGSGQSNTVEDNSTTDNSFITRPIVRSLRDLFLKKDQETNNTDGQSDTEEDSSTTDNSSTTRPRGRSLMI
jgi:hypothetical protein